MKRIILSTLVISQLFVSCKKDDTKPTKDVKKAPTTYNFENVSFAGQTTRLTMLGKITAEMKKTNKGTTIDAAVLTSMFANKGNPFGDATLDGSGKDLKSKCFAGAEAKNAEYFNYLLGSLAGISKDAGNTWAPGTAGVAKSGSKSYFFNKRGVEYTQIIEKGLMGAVFYYNIAEKYTRDGKIGNGVDNTNVTAGKGTDMEHHWDEAFGYFGAPLDFSSTNKDGAKFHAKYAKKGQDAGLETIDKVMGEFLKGRFAISEKNYTDRDAAAVKLRKEYEMILVTTAIHYLNSTKGVFSDAALRNHALSEAYAFIFSLAYNSDKKITSSDLKAVMANFEIEERSRQVMDFNQVTIVKINAAIDKLSAVYGLDDVKSKL